MTEAPEPTYSVVWPLGARVRLPSRPPRPLSDLNSARIAFVWDYVFRGDEMFAVIEEVFAKEHPGVRFVPHATFGDIHGHAAAATVAALPDLLTATEADAVIVGVGA